MPIEAWFGVVSYGLSYVYMGRYLTGRGLPPLVLSTSQLIAASGLLLLAAPFGGLTPPTWKPDAIAALLVRDYRHWRRYLINYRIISDDGPVLASTVTYLMPVVAVILGAVVLDEPITIQLVAGVLIVVIGIALTRHRTGTKPKPETRPVPIPALPNPPLHRSRAALRAAPSAPHVLAALRAATRRALGSPLRTLYRHSRLVPQRNVEQQTARAQDGHPKSELLIAS